MMNFPPFVPEATCLDCRGCCRFDHAESPWRPYVTAGERMARRSSNPRETETVFPLTDIDAHGRLRAGSSGDRVVCVHLKEDQHLCRVYGSHPMECRLYPFVLRRQNGNTYLSAHLACPHVRETRFSREFKRVVEAYKEVLSQRTARRFLSYNPDAFQEYPGSDSEFEDLCRLDIPRADPRDLDLLRLRWMYEKAAERLRWPVSTSSFVNLWIWKDFFDFEMMTVGEFVFPVAMVDGTAFGYCPPLNGDIDGDVLKDFFTELRLRAEYPGAIRLENVPLHLLPGLKAAGFEIRRSGTEYGYRREDLVGLRGNAHKSRRAALNHFRKNHAYEFLPFHAGMMAECAALFDRWAGQKLSQSGDNEQRWMIEDSRTAHQRGMGFFEELGLTGRVMKVDGNIQAYTFGFPLNPDTFCVLFEIADLSYKGIASSVFHCFCDDPAVRPYTWINTMDDSGLPGLRQSKQACHPACLWPLYSVYEKR